MVAGEVPVRRAASDAPCSSSSMAVITTVSGEPSSSTTCSSRCTRTPAATVSEWEGRHRAAERWQHRPVTRRSKPQTTRRLGRLLRGAAYCDERSTNMVISHRALCRI
jgi:hypothetical protein